MAASSLPFPPTVSVLAPPLSGLSDVGRVEGTENHVTLYAYDAKPSGTTLPMLWSGMAGFWPNTGGNANIVPTVANGRMFVGSNQQLQIFGLTKSHRPPRPPFPIGGIHPVLQAIPGLQFWGTVKSAAGTRITVEPRDGRELQVDSTPAVQKFQTEGLQIGELVVMRGKRNPDGSLQADSVTPAKGKGLWGEDAAGEEK